jgi:hypothetical protein
LAEVLASKPGSLAMFAAVRRAQIAGALNEIDLRLGRLLINYVGGGNRRDGANYCHHQKIDRNVIPFTLILLLFETRN